MDVNEHRIPFDLGVFRASRDTIIPRDYHPNGRSMAYEELPPGTQSVIVYALFTAKAADYYIRDEFTEIFLSRLQREYGQHFCYDNYRILRKEAAYHAGIGKIARNSILFSRHYGFNCKIDLMLSDLPCEDVAAPQEGDYRLEYCQNCIAPCVQTCPVNCRMNFDLFDWRHCSHHLGPAIQNPDLMCRACLTACPHSEALLKQVPQHLILNRFAVPRP